MLFTYFQGLSRQQKGNLAERRAYRYLKKAGLTLVTRNYRTSRGEIDLIMKDGKTVVFVEVRYRRTPKFGHSLDSVNKAKQRRILYTANHYLRSKNYSSRTFFRFDVIAMHSDKDDFTIEWFKNAFSE